MALTKTQVSQLYVSIFGRASEGAGNTYWQAQTDLTTAAANMLATPAAATYFGSKLDTDQAFIEHIYENTLGKTYAEDTEGVDYWVSLLEGGKSKGEVVAALIEAAQSAEKAGPAQDMFNNKVAVSDYVADTIATADLANLSAFTAYIANVTHDSATVDSAKSDVDVEAAKPDTGMLTEALATLEAANTAKTDFLEDTLATYITDKKKIGTKLVDEDTPLTSVETQIGTDYTDGATLMQTATGLGTGASGAGFKAKSDSLQDSAIAETLADLKKAVEDAKDAAVKGMTSLIEDVNAKVKVANAKIDAAIKTGDALTKEKTVFDSLNALTVVASATAETTTGNSTLVTGITYELVIGSDAVTVYKVDTTAEASSGSNDGIIATTAVKVAKLENGTWKATEITKLSPEEIIVKDAGMERFSDLLDALQADKDAKTAEKNAKEALETAVGKVVLAENKGYSFPNTVDLTTGTTQLIDYSKKDTDGATAIEIDYVGNTAAINYYKTKDDEKSTTTSSTSATDAAPKAAALVKAIEDLATFKENSDAYVTARTLNDELKALKEAITAATEAITNDTDDEDAPGLGLDLKTIVDNPTGLIVNETADSKNNVFLLDLTDDSEVQIANFGTDGLDQLFVGSGYNFVKLGSKEKIEGNLGDVSKLEIFYKQDGSDVKLYIENETFAGNSKGTEDMVTVTLTGVDVDDLTFGTFIQAGEIA